MWRGMAWAPAEVSRSLGRFVVHAHLPMLSCGLMRFAFLLAPLLVLSALSAEAQTYLAQQCVLFGDAQYRRLDGSIERIAALEFPPPTIEKIDMKAGPQTGRLSADVARPAHLSQPRTARDAVRVPAGRDRQAAVLLCAAGSRHARRRRPRSAGGRGARRRRPPPRRWRRSPCRGHPSRRASRCRRRRSACAASFASWAASCSSLPATERRWRSRIGRRDRNWARLCAS